MTLLEQGFQAFQQQDYQTAAQIWAEALTQSPTDHDLAKLHLNLGIAHSHLRHPTDAISHYRRAIAFSEQTQNLCVLGRACMGLGTASHHLNQLDEAVRYMERAIKIFEQQDDPISKEKARARCGLAYLEAGRTEDAQRSLQEAYQALLALGRIEEATTVLAELKKP